MLETGLRDPIVHFRMRLLRTVLDLLSARPLHEQSLLLSVLANKLGDPDKQVGAQASYLSVQLLQKNRALRRPLVREIENLLMRPTSPPRASLYGICALNQLALSRSEMDLAAHLVRFYFTMFELHLKRARDAPVEEKKAEGAESKKKHNNKGKKRDKRAEEELERQREEAWMDSKLLSALLTGVNRAFPCDFAFYLPH